MNDVRIEKDLLGEREIPANAFWGIHTLRAIENYPISGVTIGAYPRLIQGLSLVKQAAAMANRDLGLLDGERADAIMAACQDVIAGKLDAEFPVDVIQGGAGTSTNMNANEVIANRALQLLGRPLGDYGFLHPLNHVNMSQSTNDVYPTAMSVATLLRLRSLLDAMDELRLAFLAKARSSATCSRWGERSYRTPSR